MKTETLAAALKVCKGAVETAAIYPIFSHFCFASGAVYAYNDLCAILAPLDVDITAGLRGDTLLGLLPTLGEEVTLTQEEGTVTLKSGKSKVDLPALLEDAFMFEAPEVEWDLVVQVTAPFLDGLQRCAETVGDDSQNREFTGVTIAYDKGLSLFSSDNTRLSCFDAKGGYTAASTTTPGSWMLSGRACTLLVEAWMNSDTEKEASTCTLHLSKDWLLFSTPNLLFYSKLLPEAPPDFAGVLKRIAPKKATWMRIPVDFRATVARALVLTAKAPTAALQLWVEGKTLLAELAQTGDVRFGDLSDASPLSEEVAPALTISIGVVKLAESLERAEFMCFSERCLGVRVGGYTCWIATLQNQE